MKKASKRAVLGLLLALAAGSVLGLLVWLAGVEGGWRTPLGLALGFGLFYLHMRWLKNENRPGNGPKLKRVI